MALIVVRIVTHRIYPAVLSGTIKLTMAEELSDLPGIDTGLTCIFVKI